jgi:mannan endo-1,4-beta-mannosidase
MWAKISMAIAMPFVVAAGVGAVLVTTHHTKVPPLSLPAMPTALPSPSAGATTPAASVYQNACNGQVPKLFAGIAVNNQVANRVGEFQQMTGARIKVVEFYNPFPGPFQATEAFQATKVGALPLVQLNPRKARMRDIVAGRYDSVIKSYARAVRAFGCQVILSLGHEMNGWWYHWGLPWTKPSTFIAAWRHFHNIFTTEGVRNVIWSWDPSHQYSRYQGNKVAWPASEWYPGSKYVDWVGLDGYLNPGQNFKEVFTRQLASIRSVAASKLIYLAETGVALARNVHQIRQIDDLFAGLKSYHLGGLVWFDQNAKQAWELTKKRPLAIAEYRKFVTRFP